MVFVCLLLVLGGVFGGLCFVFFWSVLVLFAVWYVFLCVAGFFLILV